MSMFRVPFVLSLSFGWSTFSPRLKKFVRPRPSTEKLAEECNVPPSTLQHWFTEGSRLLYIVAAGKVEFWAVLVQLISHYLGTPYILIALAALDMKNDIINRKFTTVQDISSLGFKLRDPGGEHFPEPLRTELRIFRWRPGYSHQEGHYSSPSRYWISSSRWAINAFYKRCCRQFGAASF